MIRLTPLAIAGLAFALRVFRVGPAYEVFVDEIFYVRLSESIRAGELPTLRDGRPFFLHPPGFFVLEAGYRAVVGTATGALAQVTQIRVLNALLAAVTVALVFAIARRVSGPVAAVAAATVIAVDPFVVRQNGRVLLETATMMWVLAGYLGALRLFAGDHPCRWGRRSVAAAALTGLAFGAAVLTKDMAAIVTVVPLVGYAVLVRDRVHRRLVAVMLAATAAPYAGYVALVAAAGHGGLLWEQKTAGLARLAGTKQISGFNREASSSLLQQLWQQLGHFWATYLLLGLGVLAMAVLLRRADARARLICLYMGASVVLLGYALAFGNIEEHFLYFLFLPAAMCVCCGAAELLRRTPPARRRVVAALLAVVFVLDVAGSARAYVLVRSQPDDGIARLAAWMDEHVRPGARVAVTTGVQEMVLAPRYDVSHWVSIERLRTDRIDYVVLSTKHVVVASMLSPRSQGRRAASTNLHRSAAAFAGQRDPALSLSLLGRLGRMVRMFGYGWCSGMGAGGWLLMIAFWGTFLGLVAWALVRLFPGRSEVDNSDAGDVLDRRFAAGEIDAETYRQARVTLADTDHRSAGTASEK